MKSAYAISKMRKTGYSKKKFYTEALDLYKKVCFLLCCFYFWWISCPLALYFSFLIKINKIMCISYAHVSAIFVVYLQVRGALETLVSALTPIAHAKPHSSGVQPALMNTDLLSREAESISLLLSLLVRILSFHLFQTSHQWIVICHGLQSYFLMLAVRGRFLYTILHTSNFDCPFNKLPQQVLIFELFTFM